MRLGQLSRKLEVTTTDITDYLSENGFEIKDHPNVKLDEEKEQLVIAYFSPEEPDNTTLAEDGTAENQDQAEPELLEVDENNEENVLEEEEMENESINTTDGEIQPDEPPAEEQASDDEGEPEVIRAPKVELEGLKVVGKIDLPEPKLKKEEEKPEKAEKEEDPDKVKIVRHSRKNSRKQLTPEEREARRIRNKKAKEKRLRKEREKQKEREQRQEKKKKEQHYKQKINKDLPVSSKAKKKKKKTSKQSIAEDTRPQPKTLMGKFWRWLNT